MEVAASDIDSLLIRFKELQDNQILSACTTIRLYNSSSRRTQVSMETISELARKFPQKITALGLRNAFFGSKGSLAFLKAMPALSSLKDLDLSSNDMDDEGAEILAGKLKMMPLLKSLRLSGNKITNRGVVTILTHLPKECDVVHVNMNPAVVTEEVVAAIEQTRLIDFSMAPSGDVELNARITALIREKKRIRSLPETERRLMRELEEEREDNEKLNQQVFGLNEQMKVLENRLAERERENQILQLQKNHEETLRKKAEQDLEKTAVAIKESKIAMEAEQQRVKKCFDEIAALREKIPPPTDPNPPYLMELAHQNQALIARVDESRKENTGLVSTNATLTAEKAALGSKLQELQQENAQLKQQITTQDEHHNTSFAKLSEELAKVVGERDDLRKERDEIALTLKDEQSRIVGLGEKTVQQYKQKLDEAERDKNQAMQGLIQVLRKVGSEGKIEDGHQPPYSQTFSNRIRELEERIQHKEDRSREDLDNMTEVAGDHLAKIESLKKFEHVGQRLVEISKMPQDSILSSVHELLDEVRGY